jgi:6-phosphogluconolactonase
MTTVSVTFREFPSRQALAEALAEKVAATLAAAISTRGRALIAVSGGTTPELFFRQLSKASIDWSRVTVTLADERLVEPSSERSNEGLVRRTLLQGPAAAARFVPLYRTAPDAPDAFRETADELASLNWPLDVAALGMGGDGHTASFFPDAPNLADLLDPAGGADLDYVTSPSAVETRFTLSLARLASAGFIALHIEGEAKRKVLASVLEGEKLPIRAVLDHAHRPVEVFWAP